METLEALLTRRSVRRFSTKAVPAEEVTLILKAAMQAPSAANAQPWHFIVIDDRNLLEEVPKFHPNAESLHHAQLAILVCGDERLIKMPDRWILDCSAATQNILIATHGLGLGAVWLGIYPDPLRIERINQLFALPAEVHPLSLVAIGYPIKHTKPTNNYKADRIHHNGW